MFYSWIPSCAKIFVDNQEYWQYLVPHKEEDSSTLIEEFFACVAALMSLQLRSLVIKSLDDLLTFFQLHHVSSYIMKLIIFHFYFVSMSQSSVFHAARGILTILVKKFPVSFQLISTVCWLLQIFGRFIIQICLTNNYSCKIKHLFLRNKLRIY